jgi:hypothetical protein
MLGTSGLLGGDAIYGYSEALSIAGDSVSTVDATSLSAGV